MILLNSFPIKGELLFLSFNTSLEFISNYGLDQFLKKAIGMFAMVVIDLLNKELNFISDQFSQKPLYYSMHQVPNESLQWVS